MDHRPIEAFTGQATGFDSLRAVLTRQHGEIRELLAVVKDVGGERREQAFDALRELLAAHETAEEIVVRPVSVQVMDRDAAAERNHEERRIVGLLLKLEKLDARGVEFDSAFGRFEQDLLAHLDAEESEEFPALEREVDAHELDVMSHWIEKACRLGPTHAHPATAGSPVAQRTVAPFMALLDRARDHLTAVHDEEH